MYRFRIGGYDLTVVVIFLLLVSAFFSGSETALTATSKLKLQSEANQGNKKAEKLLGLISRPSEFITTILIGNNIANLVLPVLVTTIALSNGFSVTWATVILTVTIIIFSEVFPKSIAAAFPERISMLVMPIINFLIIVFKPVTIVFNRMTDFITNKLSKGEKKPWTVSKDELISMIEIADEEGVIDPHESLRVRGILDFTNLNVKDVLQTPRVEMVALKYDMTFDEVSKIVTEGMYTRYPVYREDLDDIVGVFHTKYILKWSLNKDDEFLKYCDTKPLTVREFQSVEDVLRMMTRERRHMAIVLDEYGGTEGILTHEDIIETLLGFEIEDEMDDKSEAIVRSLKEDQIICEGKITLHRLNAIFQTEIPEEEDTLSGYLYFLFDDIPDKGDSIEIDGLKFDVLQMEENTIRLVKVTKLK